MEYIQDEPYSDPNITIFGPVESHTSRVHMFDLDGTLITTRSGNICAKNSDDWKLLPGVEDKLRDIKLAGGQLVVFTNQAAMPNWFGEKLDKIYAELGFEFLVLAATHKDKNRKPHTGMYNWYLQNIHDWVDPSFIFVGDAAGRPYRDFSCSDRQFAYNCSVRGPPVEFMTREEFFYGDAPATFDWGPLNGNTLFMDEAPNSRDYDDVLAKYINSNNIIIMCGYPASGKSSFAREFINHQYISGDIVGSAAKCQRLVRESKTGVIVDITNLKRKTRALYVEIAKSLKKECVCIHIDVSKNISLYANEYRKELDANYVQSEIAFRTMFKSYEPPNAELEGFTLHTLKFRNRNYPPMIFTPINGR